MPNLYVFDTETTGLPLYKLPSDDAGQPHLVDIASILYDKHGTKLDSFEAIIKPDGWVITEQNAAIHGITHEHAMDVGISEAEAIEGFMAIHMKAGLRVAHNCQFDDRIIRIALKRYVSDMAADLYKMTPSYCTMRNSKALVKAPPTEKQVKAGFKAFKNPNLAEAYKFFTGEDLVGAHRAMADSLGCSTIYFALQALGITDDQ